MKRISIIIACAWLVSNGYAQNVGIGTSAPQNNLHLHSGTSSSTLQLSNNITGSGPAQGATIRMLGGNLFVSNQETTGLMSFSTNSQDRLLIKANGNIGINNNDPQTVLHINARPAPDPNANEALRIGGTTPYQSFFDGANYRGYIQAWTNGLIIGSTSGNGLRFYTNTSIERMTVLANGKVGINEPNPSRRFVVRDSDVGATAEISNAFTPDGSAIIASVNGADPSSSSLAHATAIRGVADGLDHGIWGQSKGNGTGVWGSSSSGIGGFFTSNGETALVSTIRGIGGRSAEFAAYDPAGEPMQAPVLFTNTVPSARGSFPFAFTVTSTGTNRIIIPNTTHANSGSDLLFVTHKGVAANVNTPVYVSWNGTNWSIFTESTAAIPVGEVYNVMVVKTPGL